ncbi:hypothetical protein [Polyangium aurulentum]|uniref:hypothetical protein n=1 Tax=Polyangium aurulentum TaxID=2567896 RepID=UPI0010ADF6A9|nr:hypothetical protein [Polyangium aurulentum]UQA56297.1 hypothetical protein E8A73_034015 [Polyangium aurulentum]
MPELRKNLDIYQGYNYKKDKQTPVGFITKLKIGTQDLTADQTCKDPTDPTKDLKVVAVLSGALWQLGVTDAVYLSGQISTANKQNVGILVINNLTNIEVDFQFSVYDYDPIAKKYFLAFHSNSTDMKGLLEKRNDELNVTVDEDASTEVQSPENYAFTIGVKPQPQAQTLHVATGDQKNIVKSWGLAVS